MIIVLCLLGMIIISSFALLVVSHDKLRPITKIIVVIEWIIGMIVLVIITLVQMLQFLLFLAQQYF